MEYYNLIPINCGGGGGNTCDDASHPVVLELWREGT